jgi:hypothetical protein
LRKNTLSQRVLDDGEYKITLLYILQCVPVPLRSSDGELAVAHLGRRHARGRDRLHLRRSFQVIDGWPHIQFMYCTVSVITEILIVKTKQKSSWVTEKRRSILCIKKSRIFRHTNVNYKNLRNVRLGEGPSICIKTMHENCSERIEYGSQNILSCTVLGCIL